MKIILNNKNLKDFPGKSNWDFETPLKIQWELWEQASEWQMPAGTKKQNDTIIKINNLQTANNLRDTYIFPHSKC